MVGLGSRWLGTDLSLFLFSARVWFQACAECSLKTHLYLKRKTKTLNCWFHRKQDVKSARTRAFAEEKKSKWTLLLVHPTKDSRDKQGQLAHEMVWSDQKIYTRAENCHLFFKPMQNLFLGCEQHKLGRPLSSCTVLTFIFSENGQGQQTRVERATLDARRTRLAGRTRCRMKFRNGKYRNSSDNSQGNFGTILIFPWEILE